MESSGAQDKEIHQLKRSTCCGWGHQNAAIIVGFLTFANGMVTMVSGIEGLVYGSSILNDQNVLEAATGSGIAFSALALLVILFSRLKVKHSMM